MKFDNYIEDSVKFKNQIIDGFLKKQVSESKLFVREKFPTRYYIIDFNSAKIYIKHDPQIPNEPSSKCILF